MQRHSQGYAQQLVKRYSLARKIPYSIEQWFIKYKWLSKNESHHVLLESGLSGRYSIIGLRPWAIVEGKDNELFIMQNGHVEKKTGNPLVLMKEWMDKYRTEPVQDYPDFQGGAIGYISYDYVRQIEKIGHSAADDLETNDLYFLVFDDVFVFDHHEQTLWIMTHYNEGQREAAEARLSSFEQGWLKQEPKWEWDVQTLQAEDDWEASLPEEQFVQAVKKIQDYIANGDVFQVNLSVRQSKTLKTPPLHIYEKLRELNPSPYMGYLHTPSVQFVGGSPELLIKLKNGEISTRPIAGTRSRGKNAEEDERLARTLIENEKEKAEHVMLVDLERNDLGRVSRYGTVEVNELMVIEKYSHVMHIVSNVRGQLADGLDAYDVIEAVFPGGTITGAPKVRTMEIIEELEPVRRGIYTGSIGWIGFNGEMELNIVIRTMVAKNGRAYVQAGAGIVIDSEPASEYKESLKKARALWKAKELSEEELTKITEKLS
ncbi:anthranilate synthase component I family protein [Anaerobacillus sp. MEB173]|uniref:anthranilate synthase component I family protein n=1 Tax=Anaerobacillus sp. MEB173 TaxID=3383345 RepID=UPI003F91ACE9